VLWRACERTEKAGSLRDLRYLHPEPTCCAGRTAPHQMLPGIPTQFPPRTSFLQAHTRDPELRWAWWKPSVVWKGLAPSASGLAGRKRPVVVVIASPAVAPTRAGRAALAALHKRVGGPAIQARENTAVRPERGKESVYRQANNERTSDASAGGVAVGG